jgi:hypothetical protein
MEKNLFTYWHQGWDATPPVLSPCARSLERHHESWHIHRLDARNITHWLDSIPIPKNKWKELPLAHRSDIIRTQLLANHGGVWADPTIWFSGPIDQWIQGKMGSGLFLFHRPGRDRLISNWFIAAEPQNPLLSRLYDELCRYWRDNEFKSIGFTDRWQVNLISRAINRNLYLPDMWLWKPMIHLLRHAPYMVYHYLFARLVRKEPECANVWNETPKISAEAPHLLLRHGLENRMSPMLQKAIQSGNPPLFKLTWKISTGTSARGSLLSELFRREGLTPPPNIANSHSWTS